MDNKIELRKILNLTFCSFGIQFGSALQMANMSSIFKFLGANINNLAILWLAAPIMGLLVQPIIGCLSDNSRSRFGRRRQYMLFCAFCALISLFMLPNLSSLWLAVVFLWLLDFSNNGATEPFRALIADATNRKQRIKAFSFQTAFSGIGATIAAILPWLLQSLFHFSVTPTNGHIPLSIKIAFYLGGTMFFLATLWTVVTTPEDVAKTSLLQKQRPHLFQSLLKQILTAINNAPENFRKFYLIQLCTWSGLFCMWLYFSLAVAENVYGLPIRANLALHPEYASLLTKATTWTGVCFAVYQSFSIIYALSLNKMTNYYSYKLIHGVSLLFGALSLIAIYFIHNPYYLLPCMLGIGATWGSIMTMPYTIISLSVPKIKFGIYMGLFNITITLPQIMCALLLNYTAKHVFMDNAALLIIFSGCLLLIAGSISVYQAIYNPDCYLETRLDNNVQYDIISEG